MRRDITEAECDRLVQLIRAIPDTSSPDNQDRKFMLRLRNYCRRLMDRCSDPIVMTFMALSYVDPRKSLYWNERWLSKHPDDFYAFESVLMDLSNFPDRICAAYARSLRRLDKLIRSNKPLRRGEHSIFLTLLIQMAEKLKRSSDVERWKQVKAILEKRGSYHLKSWKNRTH
jgi:hypothetical protein